MIEERTNIRQFPRYAVAVKAQLDVNGQTVVAMTKDLSRGGICLVCARATPAGSRLRLQLGLSLGANSFAEGLDLAGRVIWCTPIGAMFQLGVVFTEMAPAKIGQLEMFLRFLQQEILVDAEPATPNEQFDTGGEEDS